MRAHPTAPHVSEREVRPGRKQMFLKSVHGGRDALRDWSKPSVISAYQSRSFVVMAASEGRRHPIGPT